MSDYLDALDAAADWQPFDALILDGIAPASFQEWNQRRVADGLPVGTFSEYVSSIGGFSADNAPDDREWPAHPYEE